MSNKDPNQIEPLLPEHIEACLAGDGDSAAFVILLSISGGLPHQSFQLNLTISGHGTIHGDLSDALLKRYIVLEYKPLTPKQIRDLLKFILETGILTQKPELPQFVPDTLIGSLNIQYGEFVNQALFHADDKQAKTAQTLASIGIMHLVKYLYVLARDLFDVVIDPNESGAD